jgi:hypothetical protein
MLPNFVAPLTYLEGLPQQHPYICSALSAAIVHSVTTKKLRARIRSLGAVYVELCSTGEKCVKSTRRLIACFRSETANRSQQNGILANRISDHGEIH